MRKIHFFRAFSRLGLPNFPVNQRQLNIGVEDAPKFIVTKDFLTKFKNGVVTDFIFPKPEEIVPTDSSFYKVLANSLKRLKQLINQTLKLGETQVVVGGDNSVTFSSLLASLERVGNPAKVGYLQLDSHGEMNSFKASPSKNFHGMYMRPFFDSFDIAEVEKLVGKKLPSGNALFIGARDLDGDEPDFFKKKNFKVIGKSDLTKAKKRVLDEVGNFIKGFEHVHVNFDIDIFDSALAPATGIPTKDGFSKQDVFWLLKVALRHPSVSFDLTEVNPQKRGGAKTTKLAQEVLQMVML